MELRVLRYFLAVAREGSLTGASAVLHITQPTLSRQMRDLEDELGRPLFVRGSHSMSLTPEGALLRRRAEEIVSMAERTRKEFRGLDRVAGEISIGSGETAAISMIAETAVELRQKYPDVTYSVFSGNATDVTEKLDRGLLDFGLLIQPADISKYESIHLPAIENWGILMRKDHHLAAKSSIEKEDLMHTPIILSRHGLEQCSSDSPYFRWFGNHRNEFEVVSTYNLIFNAAAMVRAGLGCAVVLDRLADTSSESELCFRPLEPKLETGLDLVWKKGALKSPAAERFLDFICEKFKLQEADSETSSD